MNRLGVRLRRLGFMVAPPRPSGFATEAGRAAYEAAYRDAVEALWPVPVASVFVETRYGTTHALVSGPEDAPPLVLLHGAGLSAVSWFPNAARLAAAHRIFSLDSVFDSGLGRQTGIIRGRRDVARWLAEVIHALGLTRPAVAGLSQGGWAVASLALFEPGSVARAALLAPAATLRPFRLPVALGARYGYLLPNRDPVAGARRTFGMVFGDRFTPDERFIRLAAAGTAHFRYARPPVFPTVFPDGDLAAIAVPLLVLVSEKDVIYDPRRAFERARRVMPDAETEMVPGAGHFVAMEAAELVSTRLLDFFASPSEP